MIKNIEISLCTVKMNIYLQFSNSSFLSVLIKEIRQIVQDKSLITILILSPIILLLVYGFALNPNVKSLTIGVTDYSQTYQSRELVSALVENDIFILKTHSPIDSELERQVREGKLTAGLIIPNDFTQNLLLDLSTAEVQVFIDGVDANTAGIASGYINQIIQQYNRKLMGAPDANLVKLKTIFFYNPGLISSWFFIPGIMGIVCTIVSSLVSAGVIIKEKDKGTLEQLLMTPVKVWEILLSKIISLLIFLIGNSTISLLVSRVIFGIPFCGNLLLFYLLSMLYIFVGIGIGIILATIARTQTQTFLASFFINLPLIQLSGAIAPAENMPNFMRYLSLFDPLTHYIAIIRGIMLRGVGLEVLWQNALALLGFTIVILSVSINRFRHQLV